MATKKRGFTLLELIVVVMIIGLISSMALVSFKETRREARDAQRVSDIEQIRLALEQYYHDEGNYPESLIFGESLTGSSTDKIYLNKIPQNPLPRSKACDEDEYYYEKDEESSSYILKFCLEKDNSHASAGQNCFGPLGQRHCIAYSYTLNYSAGDGGYIVGNKSQVVESGKSGTTVKAQPNTGYSFLGWSDHWPTATRVDANTKDDLSVMATFRANDYNISFDSQGGDTNFDPKNVIYDQQVGSLPVPQKEGHLFTGWYTSPINNGDRYDNTTTYKVANNITLYAQWQVLATVPIVTINDILTEAGPDYINATGRITSDGGKKINVGGFLWSTKNNKPWTFVLGGADVSQVIASANEIIPGENFSYEISELSPLTTYYVRAFATNEIGTGYSDIISRQTESNKYSLTIENEADTSYKVAISLCSSGEIIANCSFKQVCLINEIEADTCLQLLCHKDGIRIKPVKWEGGCLGSSPTCVIPSITSDLMVTLKLQ